MFCCTLLFCNHLDSEERSGYFAQFVFVVSRVCCVALSRGAMGLSAVFVTRLFEVPPRIYHHELCQNLPKVRPANRDGACQIEHSL